jgi:hypothetical protein
MEHMYPFILKVAHKQALLLRLLLRCCIVALAGPSATVASVEFEHTENRFAQIPNIIEVWPFFFCRVMKVSRRG